MERSEASRPICYLAVRDDQTRAELAARLAAQGWHVVPKPTGFHLLEELAGTILGDRPTPVDLVVVEDRLPGCRGRSIAEGLQQLGIAIPVKVLDDGQWPSCETPLFAA